MPTLVLGTDDLLCLLSLLRRELNGADADGDEAAANRLRALADYLEARIDDAPVTQKGVRG